MLMIADAATAGFRLNENGVCAFPLLVSIKSTLLGFIVTSTVTPPAISVTVTLPRVVPRGAIVFEEITFRFAVITDAWAWPARLNKPAAARQHNNLERRISNSPQISNEILNSTYNLTKT